MVCICIHGPLPSPRGRSVDAKEVVDKSNYFLTPDEFRAKIANDEFIEYEEVYKDNFYGTLKNEVERIRENGQNVVFDVDVVGGVNIKNIFGDEALSMFIMPPSVEELRNRLVGRNTDSAETIEKRLAKAEYEISFADKFDKIVINDNLETAKAEALTIIKEFVEK